MFYYPLCKGGQTLNGNSNRTSGVMHLLSAFLLFLSFFAFISCDKKPPVKIGYVGGLTDRVADLGIAGRDGVILAVEEINRKGGINGRTVQLFIRDDKQDAATAIKVDKELIDEGVTAIIGHMTSSMSMAALPLVNNTDTLMISPTTSTNTLTGMDDNFFRVYPENAEAARLLANHAFADMNIRDIAVLFDLGNRAYTDSSYRNFRKEFERLGGTIKSAETYTSGPEVAFTPLARKIMALKPDGLFILASAMDTAMMCQQLKKMNAVLPIITGEWSVTEDVLEFGGKAVEGIHFYHTFDKTNKNPLFMKFRNDFQKRFGYEAGFASVHAYDAAGVLFRALQKNDNPSGLKETMKEMGPFEGLQGEITLDRFGDVSSRHFLMTIRDGAFYSLD